MAIGPELEFVPEQEQDLEFAPLSQEEAGNLTKAEYLASGGKPEDVISPERKAILDQETQRQLQAGATPQQASIQAGKAVDAMGAIRRPDGTIAEGYKPTAQALAEGIIETPAIPAVKEAQRLGIETVSSGTDKATGVGFAIGRNKDGKVVRFEADKNGNVDSFELEPEEPSRLGAIARTVASQVIPATTGAVAAETAAALTPGGILPKLATGAIAGIGGFIAGQKGQEAAGKALLGPERMARISEVLQRDVEKYPITTTAASILTPTGGGLVGLAKGVRGALTRTATQAAEAVVPAVAPAVESVVPKAAIAATENVPTKTFYHGSPATSIENIKSDARGLVFVSESKDVSSSYRLSRTKDIDLNKVGLTNEERLSYDMYRKGLREDPTANPDQFLSSKQFDEASSALEKIETYKKTLAEQGKIYEINIPTDKIIDWRNPDNFYKTLSAVEADLRTSGETTLANILRNSISNKIPPQSGLLGKPVFDSLKKQGIEGITLPHSREGSETMLIRNALEIAPKAEKAAAKAGVPPVELPIELQALPKGIAYRQAGVKMVKDPFLNREVREQLAKSEDIKYAKFGQKALQDALVNESDDVVRGIFESGTAPQKVIANAELINRASKQNDVKSLLDLAKTRIKLPTEAAQTVAAMRTLPSATPNGYLATLSVFLDKNGRTLTEPLLVKARNLFNLQAEARLNYETLAQTARNTLDDIDIKKAIQAEKAFIESAFRFQNFESRLVPKKFFAETLPTVIQGNLLASLSLVTNLWSNAVSSLPRAMGRQGAFISQEVARAFKKSVGMPVAERTVSSPISLAGARRVGETVKAFVRGGGEGLAGLKRGISAEGLLSGEQIRGFQPIQAFRQFWTGSGLAQPVLNGWKGLGQAGLDRARLAAETVLGVPPETMLRLLQLGDTPFRRMAQARLLSESAQLQRTSKISSLNSELSKLLSKPKATATDSAKIQDIRNQIESIGKRELGKEISVATRLPSKEELGKIEQEAAEAVFQQDTPLSRAALSVSNMWGLGNRVGIARTLAKTIIPYAKTPANVIDEMLDYSLPGYALVTKGIPAMQAKDARGAHMAIGKTLTSLTIGAVAKTLADAGVIGGSAEDSEKTRDIQYKTLPPRTINISALQRFAEGDSTELQPGDQVMNLEKMGIVGGMLATWNEASKATEKGDFISPEFLTALVPETLSFAMNQSFLKGTNSLLSAMLDGKRDRMDRWIANYFGTISSIAIPNTFGAISRAMSDSLPEKIKMKDVEGEGVERTLNLFNEVIKRKFPGAGEDLPRKIDIWGREIPQTPEGADPVLYNFFDFTKSREVEYDKTTLAIYKLFKETENGDVIPPKPLEQFMIAKENYRLSPELYEKYSKLRGRANRAAAEALFSDTRFRGLNSSDKVEALKSAYAQVGNDVRKEFLIRNESRIKRGQKQ